MTSEQKKSLKKLFNKKLKLAHETNKVGHEFNTLIDEIWGYHYSDKDMDWLIDSLDYGIAGLSFDDFVESMNKNKCEDCGQET